MELMPFLRGLNAEEQRILIHKIRNSDRSDGITETLLDDMTYKFTEEKLAKISEEENFNSKNRYRLQKTKLNHADKKRMPIDESKVKDLLINRPTFRTKIQEEIDNYTAQ